MERKISMIKLNRAESIANEILAKWYQRGSITDDERGELWSLILDSKSEEAPKMSSVVALRPRSNPDPEREEAIRT
jgi:hypothetical protein